MKKRRLAFTLLLWGAFHGCAFAHERQGGQGGDDTLIRASDGWHWVGHQQSDSTFITCSGTVITIEQNDKVVHGASCAMQRSALNIGVQQAISLFARYEGYGLVKLDEANAAGKYALASWTGESGKRGHAVLVTDGTSWHVLSFGKFDEREALARGVPRDTLSNLVSGK